MDNYKRSVLIKMAKKDGLYREWYGKQTIKKWSILIKMTKKMVYIDFGTITEN